MITNGRGKVDAMTDQERSDVEPTDEEAPYRSPDEVAGKKGEHEYPSLGRAGDMTSDDESLARRPAEDRDEVDGETDSDNTGTPPGSATRGA